MSTYFLLLALLLLRNSEAQRNEGVDQLLDDAKVSIDSILRNFPSANSVDSSDARSQAEDNFDGTENEVRNIQQIYDSIALDTNRDAYVEEYQQMIDYLLRNPEVDSPFLTNRDVDDNVPEDSGHPLQTGAEGQTFDDLVQDYEDAIDGLLKNDADPIENNRNSLVRKPPSNPGRDLTMPEHPYLIAFSPTDDMANAEHEALERGFRIIRKLHSFPNVFVAEKLADIRRKRSAIDTVDEMIEWVEMLVGRYREKRKPLDVKPVEKLDSSKIGMGVQQVWKEGYTGKGVTIAILDDGVDHSHADLHQSFDPSISFDFRNDVQDPTPEMDHHNSHGTHCTGIIAMSANTSVCGVGVAHGATFGGLKILGDTDEINDAIEGDALAYKSEKLSIYSVSWGPRDDGKSMERPGKLAQKALDHGATKGRNGLGSLYVWASGNGGLENDDCAADGYASNKHTMAFGVASADGAVPWFAEGCPAVMASVRVGDAQSQSIITTDIDNKCTSFTGSSAAAPLASAILALALEANPKLTSRDIRHLIVETSEPKELMSGKSEWSRNAAGHYFSRYFGFGVLNAIELVRKAKQWKAVEPQHSCVRRLSVLNGTLSKTTPLTLSLPFEGCPNTDAEVGKVELVEVDVTLQHGKRGDLHIQLVSPSGTTIDLLRPRRNDASSDGLHEWTFVVAHLWGESSKGEWTVNVSDKGTTNGGLLTAVKLTVHGTK